MQRADSPQAAVLASEVRAFLSQNPVLAGPKSAIARSWFQALRDQRWYVPHWPTAQGGLDWTPLQSYILQRELLAAGALLPPGATTHLVASWLFRWLPAQASLGQNQNQRWLAGIAGDQGHEVEHWRIGVDLRRPDWPAQALEGGFLDDRAHWVLQPYPMPDGADSEVFWAVGVLPGALLPASSEKLNPAPSQKASTDVELGVEQRWPPVLSGLTVAEVEALLKPVQAAWQNASRLAGTSAGSLGAAGEIAEGLQVPSVSLGWRLARLQQVLAADDSLPPEHKREHKSLHESQIALAALQVMEARAAQADSRLKPALPGADLQRAVGQSAERLSWRVAQLESDTLGYFALPAFDAQLQHNEGRVTPSLYDPLIAGSSGKYSG
jgi:hypothetical protein